MNQARTENWAQLVYMAADNALEGLLLQNLGEMEKLRPAVANGSLHLVVYSDRAAGTSGAVCRRCCHGLQFSESFSFK